MKEDEQPVTFRLPKELHERLRDAAWKRRVSMNTFVIEAIEGALALTALRADPAVRQVLGMNPEPEGGQS
jgi:hypothetical protein